MSDFWALLLFNLFVIGMLVVDLGVFQRREHATSFREAAIWSAVWVGLSLTFNIGLYFWKGPEPALEFLTGYVLEKSLSMDNIFVFAVIFRYAAVAAEYQHKVLFWGILGALLMRGAFIVAGVALVSRFHEVLYIFGGLLLVTGAKLLLEKEKEIHPERNPVLCLARRLFPVTERYEGGAFFVRRAGRRVATPLLLVLLMVETTDVVFALDSIPAIFAVTEDPFIIYTSNVFAILGLRAMYFLLAGAMRRFQYLRAGLSLILVFVGGKMLLAGVYKIPLLAALLGISAVLAASILVSLYAEKKLAKQTSTRQG